MKHFILTVLLLLIALSYCGAQIQYGMVRELNSVKRPLAAVQITFADAVPTTSDNNGVFRLAFRGKNAGDPIFYNEIKKNGYELVNDKDLQILRISSNDSLGTDIILALAGVVDAAKKKYYDISDKALLDRFEKEKATLRQQLADAKIAQQVYLEKTTLLQQQYDLQKIDLDALAEKFARVNFDDVSPVYKQALELFQAGKVSEAIAKLESSNLSERTSEILKEEQKIANAQQELEKQKSLLAVKKKEQTEMIRLLADMYSINFAPDKADAQYNKLLFLDSTNPEFLQDYAVFLTRQNHQEKAILYFDKALNAATTNEQTAIIFNSLGNLYRSGQKNEEAKIAYSKSLKLFRELNDVYKDRFLSQAAFALNNFGNCYIYDHQWDSAITCFSEALVILRKLNELNKDAYLPHIAFTLNNLGRCYFENRDLRDKSMFYSILIKAKDAFNESLDIYQQLADNNPQAIIPSDIRAFFDLNVVYKDNLKSQYELLKEYESILQKALKIHRQLAKERPYDFLPFVALTLNNLGNLYTTQRDLTSAKQAYDEAISILTELTEKDMNSFSPFLASTLVNMGSYYQKKGDLSSSEQSYQKALEIYKNLEGISGSVFLLSMEKTFHSLGKLKTQQNKYNQALYNYDEAFKILKHVATGNTNSFNNEWQELHYDIRQIEYVADSNAFKLQANQLAHQIDSTIAAIYISSAREALFKKDYTSCLTAVNFVIQLNVATDEATLITAHCLLLQNRFKEAKKLYQGLKGLRNEHSELAKLCMTDFIELEKVGVDNEDISKIKQLLYK